MFLRLFRRRNDHPLRIRLAEPVDVAFASYFRAEGEDTPTAETLLGRVKEWYGRRNEPLGADLVKWADRGLLNLQVFLRLELPDPPLDLLRAHQPGERELSRFEASTHVALISAPDMIRKPSFGLWSALGAAIAVAEAHDGVVIDPRFPRLLSDEETARDFPGSGQIVMPHHIRVLYSLDRRGQTWMTTKGMCRFGLPELEMVDVPPNLPDMVLPLVNGVASVLLDLAREVEDASKGRPKTWVVGPEIRINTRQIALAHGREEEEPDEGVRGWTTIRLEYRPARRGLEAFIRLVPPRHQAGEQGVWLNSALADLFGVQRTVVDVRGDDEAMARAHEQAMATLPELKQRFQRGFDLGEQLYIKHGFPREEEGLHEFMWVVVNTWTGDRVRGALANDPAYRIDLRAGQTVELTDADVFDWLLVRPDGTQEGNFTREAAEGKDSITDGD